MAGAEGGRECRRRRTTWSTFASVALAAALGLASAAEALTYKATVRSFLPAYCMKEPQEYYDIFEYAERGIPEKYKRLDAADEARRNTCAYFDSGISTGKVGGHPDFETDGNAKGAGLGILFGVSANTVNATTVTGRSGVPKPQYCSETTRCGAVQNGQNLAYATAGAKYFESWYNDDPFYNKRIGLAIKLVETSECKVAEDGNKVCEYRFDSKYDNENDPGSPSDNFFGPLDPFGAWVTAEAFPSFTTAPVWPRVRLERSHKFWFTTEIHSYFEYRGDETFRFSGDDDVWVFINSKLVVDLGGVHSKATKAINLKDIEEEAGLYVGGVFTFDLFHAERHTEESNFKLTTTLVESCNVVASGSIALEYPHQEEPAEEGEREGGNETAHVEVGAFAGPRPPLSLKLGGGAWEDAGAGTLVLAWPGNPLGSSFVFDELEHNVGSGFIIDFTFKASSAGATEGFAFVMHQRPQRLSNMPTSPGAHMGLRYLSNSVAVVFDFCADRSQENSTCHGREEVRVHFNAEDPNGYNSAGQSTRHVHDELGLLAREEGHRVVIQYLARPDWLEVYVDDSLYLRQSGFNVTEALGGGSNAFLGFTAGTGSDPGWVNITSWKVQSVSLDPSKTQMAFPGQAPADLVADGSSAGGFAVRTFDACGNQIEFGGFPHFMKALYVVVNKTEDDEGLDPTEEPEPDADPEGEGFNATSRALLVEAPIVDNGDGTYTASLVTDLVGAFEMYACFGTACWLEVVVIPEHVRRLRQLQGEDAGPGVEVRLAANSSSDSVLLWSGAAVSTVPPEKQPDRPSDPSFRPTSPPVQSPVLERLAIGGGATFAFLGILVVSLLAARRRWGRDKRFIEKGREHRMEAGVSMREDEYGRIGRMLLNTRASIMRRRAQNPHEARDAEISELREEQQELQEHLRLQKKRRQQSEVDLGPSSSSLSAFQPSMAMGPLSLKAKRKQFRGQEADEGCRSQQPSSDEDEDDTDSGAERDAARSSGRHGTASRSRRQAPLRF